MTFNLPRFQGQPGLGHASLKVPVGMKVLKQKIRSFFFQLLQYVRAW
jgi:hypothetical protein